VEKLVGRCGLFCGACVIYRTFKDKDVERAEGLAEHFKCAPEEIRCNGCQNPQLGDWSFGKEPDGSERCEIQRCLDSRGYKYCYQCPKLLECDLWEEKVNKSYEEVPYHNLMRLKEIGERAWLEEQESMWRCPKCDRPIDFFTESCRACGTDLKETRERIIEWIRSR
jgi:hypothetical protein